MNKHTTVQDELDAMDARTAFERSCENELINDVSHIVRCAPFIARYPNRLFTIGLASELAEAVDILVCKVADLEETEGASR